MISFKDKIYEYSPVFMQNVFCSLHGYKEKSRRLGDIFEERLSFLRDSQYWSIDKIKDYKNEAFVKIMKHAVETVPYYSRIFRENKLSVSDVKSLDDLYKIPVLSKDELRSNLNDFVSVSFPKKDLIKSHTSGSTGSALNFYTTKEAIQFQWAVWWRFRERFGIKLGDKHLNFTGKLVVPIWQSTPPFWRYNRAINQYLINMQHIKETNLKSIVSFINQENFFFFSGYPSIIYSLCLLIENSGLKITNPPKFVFTGAEKLYDNQRECITRVLHCIVTDQYGFSEGACNASRCKEDFFHEDFEFGHIECDNSMSAPENMLEGQILGTGFTNYAMPLIRYRVGDYGIFSEEKCSCGRRSRVLKNVEGRNEDFVITPEGTRILRFDYLFKDSANILECQVVQYKLGEVVFRIVRRGTFTLRDEEKLAESVKRWISPSIQVGFEYVEEIERTNTGKFRAVRSYLPLNDVF